MVPILVIIHCDGCDHIISVAGDINLTSLITESSVVNSYISSGDHSDGHDH